MARSVTRHSPDAKPSAISMALSGNPRMRSHLDASDPTAGTRTGALRIFIASDVRLYRESLAGSLRQRADIDILGVICLSEAAVGQVSGSAATAILLDLGAPGALRFAVELDRVAPSIKIIAFAVSEVDSELIACAEAGIVGYVGRDGSIADLVTALRNAARGEVACSPHHSALLIRRLATLRDRHLVSANPEGQIRALTSREREIAALVREGLSNKEIARLLRIGAATVKNHVHSILTKLQVKSRGQAGVVLHRVHLEDRRLARLR